MCVIDNCER